MKYVYNKLVRDNIPSQINNQDDRKAKYKILEDEEYIKELNKSWRSNLSKSNIELKYLKLYVNIYI